MSSNLVGVPEYADDRVGEVLADRYRVDELVGVGGMARVYRATDELLGRDVALKILRSDAADPEMLSRQRDEMRAVAALHHPAIVTLFDAFLDEAGRAILVMQYVRGQDLSRVLATGPLTTEKSVAIGRDLTEALASVHRSDIIHRDIKPGNILILDQGTDRVAMLGDFGIARMLDGPSATATGTVIGTAAYLSPEQALGRQVTSATDLYSLGLVLLECITGERPFPGPGLESASARLTTDPQIPATLDPRLAELLRSLTEREPSARPDAVEAAARFRDLAIDLRAGERRTAVAYSNPTDPTVPATTKLLRASSPPPTASRATTAATARWPESPASPRSRPWANIRPPSRTSLVRAAVVAVALVFATAIGIGVWQLTSTPPAPSGPAYPAVDGPLGEHLEQLQEAVEP